MHCIEINASDFSKFKSLVGRLGANVSIISKYSYRGIRVLDVEVSKDSKAIDRVEKAFNG